MFTDQFTVHLLLFHESGMHLSKIFMIIFIPAVKITPRRVHEKFSIFIQQNHIIFQNRAALVYYTKYFFLSCHAILICSSDQLF